MKHLLKMADLSASEILDILDLADELKYQKKHNIEHFLLKGKTLGMIFQKASTRTRVSFEVAMYELGGYALFLSANDLQIGRGEPVQDTARVLSRYLSALMIRTFKQQEVEDFAKYATIPIINGLTDFAHPCQVLADLMTIREYKKSFSGLKFCFIGDSNNMVNSLVVGCLKLGMKFSLACPKGYEPTKEILDFASQYKEFEMTNDVLKAAKNADVLCTDVWSSMGQEQLQEKRKHDFKNYQINDQVLKVANKNSLVLHCLPAHREEEITNDVLEKHATEIFEEAENRLHVQKAILVKLLEKSQIV